MRNNCVRTNNDDLKALMTSRLWRLEECWDWDPSCMRMRND
jgi:hypothetical protein